MKKIERGNRKWYKQKMGIRSTQTEMRRVGDVKRKMERERAGEMVRVRGREEGEG